MIYRTSLGSRSPGVANCATVAGNWREPSGESRFRASGTSAMALVPKIIWILWFQGWENAPKIAKTCMRTWRKHNPDWTIHALSSANLHDFIDLHQTHPGTKGKTLPYAVLSDVTRIALLHRFGGVWVDSTLYCNKPLDDWLHVNTESGFFAFSNPGPDRMLSTWFLAATKGSYVVEHWSRLTAEYWNSRNELHHYFWFNYLFADVYNSDAKFREIWDATPKISADGPHYFRPYKVKLARPISRNDKIIIDRAAFPVFKLTHKFDYASVEENSVLDYLHIHANADTPLAP